MHTEGIEERIDLGEPAQWFVRLECLGCGWRVGVDVPVGETQGLVDRLIWTDDALQRLDRMPPYVTSLVREEVETVGRARGLRVIDHDLLLHRGTGEQIEWDSDAEGRLQKVPAPVRAMARVELERTAADRGMSRVTVMLMEEVKAKYFGMAAQKT